MKRLATWSGLLLLLLLLAMATGTSFLYRLVSVLLIIPLLGYLAAVLTTRRLSGRVERVSAYLQVGQLVRERITVRSRHWWPKLLLEVEHQTSPLGSSGRVVTLWPYRSATWVSETLCDRRGLYEYGTLVASSRDPLGLVATSVSMGEPQTALIHPATVPLPGFRSDGAPGLNEGISRNQAYTPTPIASGVRDYALGDTISRIHWPTTVRLGKLMVKEYEQDTDAPTQKTASEEFWVVLDLWEGAQAGVGMESTVEYAVTIAASIAKAFLEDGRTVGMVAFGDTREVIQAEEGLDQFTRIMDALALIQAGRHGPLSQAIDATIEQLRGYATVLALSAGPLDALAGAVHALHQHGARLLPIYLDGPSFEGQQSIGEHAPLAGTALEALVVHRGDNLSTTVDMRPYAGVTGLGALGAGELG